MLKISSLIPRLSFIHQWQSLTLQFTFAINHRPQLNLKADRIMKNYFNLRSQMSTSQTLALIDRLKTVRITSSFLKDHRWVHLNVTINKNIEKFSIDNIFKILHGFTKMKCYNDVYSSMLDKLITQIDGLTPNQKAKVIYYMAKSSKSSTEMFVKASNSLLQSLNNNKIKMTFVINQQISSKGQKNLKQQTHKIQNQQQDNEQSLFEDLSGHETVTQSSETINCRFLVLCLWCLQKMRIKDKLLSNCIINTFIRPNMKQIPTNVMPLLMSTIWLNSLMNKRISIQAIESLRNRQQKQFIALDREKLYMLVSMLCKPQLQPKNEQTQQNKQKQHNQQNQNQQTQQSKESKQQRQKKQAKLLQIQKIRSELVLFLMQTILIKHTQKQQILYSRSAYRILTNASDVGIVDFALYQKYLNIICNNLKEIQTKQYIYLLDIIRKLRKFGRSERYYQNKQNNQSGKKICEEEYQKLCTQLRKNINGFLNKSDEDHPARKLLRKLVLTNFINLSTGMNKKLAFQQKEVSKKVLRKVNEHQNKKEPIKGQNSNKTETKFQIPIKKNNRNIRKIKKQTKQTKQKSNKESQSKQYTPN